METTLKYSSSVTAILNVDSGIGSFSSLVDRRQGHEKSKTFQIVHIIPQSGTWARVLPCCCLIP